MGRHAYQPVRQFAYVVPHGRHRRPVDRRPVVRTAVAVSGLTASAFVAAEGFAPGALAATADDFAALRMCESGGNYATNTGNGYYGAYQFDLGTWHGLGYSGLPSDASPATQDEAARKLQAERGWSPWPACSAKLGLGSSSDYSASSSSASTATTTVATTTSTVVAGPGPYRGIVLSTRFHHEPRPDVRALQKALLTAGYAVAVDGHFGKQTRHAVRRFQHDAGLTADGLAGPQTFAALF